MALKVYQVTTIVALFLSLCEPNAPPTSKTADDDANATNALVAWTYFKMRQHFEDTPGDIPKAVRLAFHQCVGGCDGCIAFESLGNRGLVEYILEQNATWTQLGLGGGAMSRTDFLTYSTYAAIDVAIELNNVACGGRRGCLMPEMEYRGVHKD